MVVVHNPTSSPSLYTEVEDLEASSSYSSTAQLLEPNKDKDEEEGGGRRRFNKTTSTSSRWPHHQQQLDPHRSLLASIFSVWHSVALLLVIAFLSIAVIIFCISRASHSSSAPHSHPPITNSSSTTTTLLISIDGCRADYLDRGLTPNLARIAKLGARAAFMIPVFPTLTFPNHYSMVTGLYPESSGIIGNRMWDCETNETFAYGGPSKWWKGEPIWVSAEKQGIRTATCMWPGSEVEIKGRRPSRWVDFDHGMTIVEKVDLIFGWLDDCKNGPPPRFITLYLPEVDTAGHLAGPDSPEVDQALVQVDQGIGNILVGLASRNLSANVIVVSDHGFAGTSSDRVIQIDDIVGPVADVVNVKWILNGPIGHAFVESDEDLAWLYSKLLRSSSSRNYSYFVYLREAVPPSFHFSSSHLIGDVVVVAPLGWVLSDGIHAHHSPPSLSSSPSSGAGPFPRGSHGWNNSLPEMQSIFLAMGPNFSHLPRTKLPPSTFSTSSTAKNNNLVPAFSSLQIYDLLSKILKINHPSPNNGTADEWAKLEPWVILDDDQNTLV